MEQHTYGQHIAGQPQACKDDHSRGVRRGRRAGLPRAKTTQNGVGSQPRALSLSRRSVAGLEEADVHVAELVPSRRRLISLGDAVGIAAVLHHRLHARHLPGAVLHLLLGLRGGVRRSSLLGDVALDGPQGGPVVRGDGHKVGLLPIDVAVLRGLVERIARLGAPRQTTEQGKRRGRALLHAAGTPADRGHRLHRRTCCAVA